LQPTQRLRCQYLFSCTGISNASEYLRHRRTSCAPGPRQYLFSVFVLSICQYLFSCTGTAMQVSTFDIGALLVHQVHVSRPLMLQAKERPRATCRAAVAAWRRRVVASERLVRTRSTCCASQTLLVLKHLGKMQVTGTKVLEKCKLSLLSASVLVGRRLDTRASRKCPVLRYKKKKARYWH
jgi:hypothetical protein